MLPGEQFEVKVTANRDNLANMLASAMMTGYFLRQMEQRKELEETLFADDEMAVNPDDDLNGRAVLQHLFGPTHPFGLEGV